MVILTCSTQAHPHRAVREDRSAIFGGCRIVYDDAAGSCFSGTLAKVCAPRPVLG